MNDQERLTLAALLHELPELLARHELVLPATLHAALAAVAADPALQALLDAAEGYATGRGDITQPVTTQPLRSIFSFLQIHHEPAEQFRAIAPLPAAHESQDVLFPVANARLDGLQAHLKSFSDALVHLISTSDIRFEIVYPHLLALLQRFGWCLAAHGDDVSLFDHARLASAIAACLYQYHAHDLSAEAVRDAEAQERFCLLVGDLSGIQSYIFNISTIGAGGVARRLRARSFYLSALADVLSHQIATHFRVPLGNVIMASGGKFYVLVPHIGDVAVQITLLRQKIDEWLRAQFNGEIAINLAQHCFAGAQFRAGTPGLPGFGSVLTTLSRALAREKQQRGHSVLAEGDGWNETAFAVERDFWGASVCASCHKNPATIGDICDQCDRDVQLGKQLPRALHCVSP